MAATQSVTSTDTRAELVHQLTRMKEAQVGAGAPSYRERRDRLDALYDALVRHEGHIVQAIREDFGHRAPDESILLDVLMIRSGIKHTRANLREWMEPERRAVHVAFQPAANMLVYEPLGVVGIISPWNYPINLALLPLVDVLAAGNRAMLKPSEMVPRTSELMATMLREAFDDSVVHVVQGGAEVAQVFSSLPFDHLVFTGSTAVGRKVMEAAAKNLTPVTLELGGKSPAILHPSYNVALAASRIASGKCFNAGQTCVAPDYVLLHETQREAFVEGFTQAVMGMFPNLATNSEYTWVVSDRHANRLRGLVDDATAKGAELRIVNPGDGPTEGRRMPPHLLTRVTPDMLVMQEEIFGPVLPVLTYSQLDEALAFVNERPKPLSFYYFDNDMERVREVLRRTSSGQVSINDVEIQGVQDALPFGGVGHSGTGRYHGYDGFRNFSNPRSVFVQRRFNLLPLVNPPRPRWVMKLMTWLLG